MKAKYENAELEVIELTSCDIVTASGGSTGDNDDDGDVGGGFSQSGWF